MKVSLGPAPPGAKTVTSCSLVSPSAGGGGAYKGRDQLAPPQTPQPPEEHEAPAGEMAVVAGGVAESGVRYG